MKKKRISRIGLYFMLPYLIPVLIALSFIIFMIIFHPRESKFLGIYLIVFAFPWTLPSTGLFEFINRAFGINATLGILLLLILLNAAILYFIGLIIDRMGILKWIAKLVKNHSVLGDDERFR